MRADPGIYNHETTDRSADLDALDLTALGRRHLATLGALEVTAEQEVFGGSFAETLAAWRKGPSDHVLGLAFLHHGAPVGAVLFKRPPLSPDWAPDNAATIHGLKIARPWQGRGWGHQAFRLALAQLRREWPTARRLMLAVDAVNAAAIAVYRRAGMTDDGTIHAGRIGPERRMELHLGH